MTFDFNKHDGESSGTSGIETPDHRPEPEGDFEYHPRIYQTLHTVVEANLGEIQNLSHDEYGQTLILYLDDAEMVQGAVYDKDQSEESDPNYNKIKLFSISALGYEPEEFVNGDVELADLPARRAETYFGDTHTFHFMGARIDADDPLEYEDVDGCLNLGTVRRHFGVSSSEENPGPTSESKRMIRLLAENGENSILDEDSTHAWADENIEMAEDLYGRRVRIWSYRRTFQKSEYNHLVIEDVETGEELPIRGTQSSGGSSSGGDEAPWSQEDVVEPDADAHPYRTRYSEGLIEVLEWCDNDEDCDEPEDVREALEKSAKSNVFDDDLSEDEVDEIAETVAAGDFE